MACEITYVHKPPSDTEVKCGGNCDVRYKKNRQGKYEPVKPTCRAVIRVEWVKSSKSFNPRELICVCTLPPIGDPPCHWEPEVDPADTKIITNPRCVGECGEYYDDALGATPTKVECQFVMDPTTKKIECICKIK
jgi:hypothetical protein